MAHPYGSRGRAVLLVNVRHAKVRIAKRKNLHVFILCMYTQSGRCTQLCQNLTFLFVLNLFYSSFLCSPGSFSFFHFFGYCYSLAFIHAHVDTVISLTSAVVIPLLCHPFIILPTAIRLR